MAIQNEKLKWLEKWLPEQVTEGALEVLRDKWGAGLFEMIEDEIVAGATLEPKEVREKLKKRKARSQKKGSQPRKKVVSSSSKRPKTRVTKKR